MKNLLYYLYALRVFCWLNMLFFFGLALWFEKQKTDYSIWYIVMPLAMAIALFIINAMVINIKEEL